MNLAFKHLSADQKTVMQSQFDKNGGFLRTLDADGFIELRDRNVLATSEKFLPRAMEFLMLRSRQTIRTMIVGRARFGIEEEVIEKFSGFPFSASPLTFANSLPLLMLVCARLGSIRHRMVFGMDLVVHPDGIAEAEADLQRFRGAGCHEDFYSLIAAGIVESAKGMSDVAERLFADSAKSFAADGLDPKRNVIPDFRGAFNTVPRAMVAENFDAAPDAMPFEVVQSVAVDPSFVSYAAVDPRYGARFAPGAIASYLEQSDETCVYHLHCVAGSLDEAKAVFEAMTPEVIGNPRVGLSFGPDASGNHGAAWYTMARYLWLEQVRALYDAPICIGDIDMIYVSDPKAMHELCTGRKATVGLYTKDALAACVPWFVFSCTLLYVSKDEIGDRFLRLLCALAQRLMRDDHIVKYNVDQNLLFALVSFFRDRLTGFTTVSLNKAGTLPYTGVEKTSW